MMLADRAVLASTLVVAFASGGAAGYSLSGSAGDVKPYAVETVFSEQIEDLRAREFAPAEVDEAVAAYADYLREYQKWWDAFVETHEPQLDRVDERLRARLQEIEAAHRARSGGSGK